MEPSSNPEFIQKLIHRPQMYVVGSRFEGIINLMFGMRLTDTFPAAQNVVVQRWLAFAEWVTTQQNDEDMYSLDVWTVFRQQYASDEDAVEGLRAAYSEFSRTYTST